MVIHDFDVGWTGGGPTKTHAVLIVNPNAVLCDPLTLERFQSATWRHT